MTKDEARIMLEIAVKQCIRNGVSREDLSSAVAGLIVDLKSDSYRTEPLFKFKGELRDDKRRST